MTYTKIKVDVYAREVWVTRDIETAKRLAWRYCKIKITDDDFKCKGFTANGLGNNVVWLHESSWVQTLAHEMTHVALNIFHHAGASVDTNNQEPTAYLVGYLTGAAFYWLEGQKP